MRNNSLSQSHHSRGSSEISGRNSNKNARDQLERNWSVNDIAAVMTPLGPGGSRHNRNPSDTGGSLLAFQESWSNVESTDFLGAAFTASKPIPSQGAVSKATSFAGFGTTPVDHSSFGRSLTSGSYHGTTKNHAGVSSVIHDAARITDWDRVLELCDSTPEAASYSGRDGWTALHHACNRRCPRPDVVEALIRAYPEALLQEEEKSWLPLHYACRFKAPREVVRLLLHMYPESGKIAVKTRDRQGRRPLYYAIRYDAPEGVAELVLAVDPSAVLDEDQNEDSPLALIWDSWAEKLEGKRIVHSFLPGGFPEPEDTTVEERAVLLRERLEKEPKLKKRWNQVNKLLKAAFGFPFENEKQSDDSLESEKRIWRIVHATAAVKCHLSLFLLACALHPEQAKQLDESDLRRPDANGNVPNLTKAAHQTALHLAASSNAGGEPGKTVVITLLSLYREAAQAADGIDGSLPLHRMVENPRKQDWPTHAAILYHFYPRAVQIQDSNGKLPLHRATAAITHEDHDGDEDRSVIIQLVRSYPQAASHTDKNGCLPFHYLAMHGAVWDDDVEAIHNSNRNAVHTRAGPEGQQPIHMAAANPKSKESMIHRLVQLHPRGASLEDRSGKLPLHLACEQGKEWDDGTRYIYEAFPAAVRRPENNEHGWTALHMASACRNSSASLIAKLVELYPEATNIADNDGRYPLHLACCVGKSWNAGMEVLFDANPIAIVTGDSKGLLPLHICALAYCNKSDDSGKKKTRAVPKIEAKKEKTVNTREAAELDILFNLIRADPLTVQL